MDTNSGEKTRTTKATVRATFLNVLIWLAVAIALFFIGRHFSHRSVDFIVYYKAAGSFLAGRRDLYSATFAWGPPMEYVYPPLFLFLYFPLGWLPFADAFGIWFAAMALATILVVRLAYREWHPLSMREYALVAVAVAAVPVLYALRNGNVHLGIVLLTVAGLVAWSRGKLWAASFYIALGGAIKIFPLFLFPFLIARREWRFAVRLALVSVVLWALPVLYYGPSQTLSLYRSWHQHVGGDVEHFESVHQLDSSLTGTTRRWLSHVDYSRYRDQDHPQVNRMDLSAGTVRGVSLVLRGLTMAVALLLAGVLPKSKRDPGDAPPSLEVAAIGALFITSQLLFGPYTIFLYLCEWLVVALTLPVVFQTRAPRVNYWLLAIGVASLAVLSVPGRSAHRALEAFGAYTFLNVGLWLISLAAAWTWLRTSKPRIPTEEREPIVHDA